jgi:hypothetical protein
MKHSIPHPYTLLLLLAAGAATFAAPRDYLGGKLVMSFNNPGFNAQGNTTAEFATHPALAGWETSAPDGQITFGWSGAVSPGRMYGYRFDSSGETSPTAGALGSRTTSATGPIHFGLGLTNSTGRTITAFSLSFSAFVAHYRDEQADQLGLAYGIGASMDAATYTSLPDGDYVAPAGSGNGNPVSGTAERRSVSVDGLEWAPGETLWIRWTDHQDEVNGGMGLGIDHLYFVTDVDRVEPYTDWVFDDGNVTEFLFVDQAHPAAADTNSGGEEAPLLTIQAAIERASTHTSEGKGTHIRIAPGIYREVLDVTSRSGNHPLIIEGVGDGEVVISGSDEFNDWTESPIDNVWMHPWPYTFGWEENPWPGDLALKYPQGTRRELLFLDKTPMIQVVEYSELAEGTYLVDEQFERVLFYPPVGVDPNAAETEISVRPQELYGADSKLLRVFRVNNVRIANLIFEHAAAGSLANDATVAFRGCSNVVIDNLTIRWSNGFGLSMGGQGDTPAENFIVRNYRGIGNGALAMDGGEMSNILFDGGEIRHTNWRGAHWGATGWAPCGFKFAGYAGMHMRDFVISQTHASGVWMDTHNRDILFERVYSVNNFRSGFSLEGNRGPIVIRDSVIFGNSTGVNGFDNSGVVIENSVILNNRERQVRFAGSIPLTEQELLDFDEGWSRDRQRMRDIPLDWTLRGNLIGSTSNDISTTIFELGLRSGSFLDGEGNARFQAFADTYTGDGNTFGMENGSGWPGFRNLTNNLATFETWAAEFGESNATWLTTEELAAALLEAEALVGEPAEGFFGLANDVPVVTVVAEAAVAREQGRLPGSFRIRREGGDPSLPLLVTFNLGGSAVEGQDYVEVGSGLLLEAGQESGRVEITPLVDNLPEFEETVVLDIEVDIDGNYRLGNPSFATLRIADRDSVVPSRIRAYHPYDSSPVSVPVTINNPGPEAMELRVSALSNDYRVSDTESDPAFEYEWTDISTRGTRVDFTWQAVNNDGVSAPLPIGFAFPFMGELHTEALVHSNGFIALQPLDNPDWRFTILRQLPDSSAFTTGAMLAGFWSNLALDAGSSVHVLREDDRFTVQYKNLFRQGVFGARQAVTFQIVLHATGEIRYLYSQIGYTTPGQSVGIQNGDGSRGLSLSFNDDALKGGLGVRMVPAVAWVAPGTATVSIPGNGSAELPLTLYPADVLRGRYSHVVELEQAGTGEVRFSLPVELEVTGHGHLLANALDLGDFRWSDWFGAVHLTGDDWLFHVGLTGRDGLGYVRPSSHAESGFWMYSESRDSWLWTAGWLYPHVWSASEGWFVGDGDY